MSDRGAFSDISTGLEVVNPILDVGCPPSVGGVQATAALCLALGTPFELGPMDCDLFFHGYGMHCSEAELTVAIWDMPVKEVSGQEAKITSYLTPSNGFLLLGNEILHQSRLLGRDKLLAIPQKFEAYQERPLVFRRTVNPFHWMTMM